MKKYTTQETPYGLVISYLENGTLYSFTDDPANSDYQAYLKSLEAEQSTPSVE
jgi:hypothetical protein